MKNERSRQDLKAARSTEDKNATHVNMPNWIVWDSWKRLGLLLYNSGIYYPEAFCNPFTAGVHDIYTSLASFAIL